MCQIQRGEWFQPFQTADKGLTDKKRAHDPSIKRETIIKRFLILCYIVTAN